MWLRCCSAQGSVGFITLPQGPLFQGRLLWTNFHHLQMVGLKVKQEEKATHVFFMSITLKHQAGSSHIYKYHNDNKEAGSQEAWGPGQFHCDLLCDFG